MAGQRLLVYGWQMAFEVLQNVPGKHLDLWRGELAPKSRARGHCVGEGRPAVEWARFLRIPCLWEAAFEVASRFPGEQTMPHRKRRHDDPRYTQAAAIVARRWLVSLKLPHEIVWAEPTRKTPRNLIYRPS